MGVDKIILSEGNGVDYPKRGDQVTMEYTGWLFDQSAASNKGAQ
jgi:FK506-binding protein 1